MGETSGARWNFWIFAYLHWSFSSLVALGGEWNILWVLIKIMHNWDRIYLCLSRGHPWRNIYSGRTGINSVGVTFSLIKSRLSCWAQSKETGRRKQTARCQFVVTSLNDAFYKDRDEQKRLIKNQIKEEFLLVGEKTCFLSLLICIEIQKSWGLR